MFQKLLSLNTSETSSSLHRFALRAELLPCYVPVRVANKILFVGESVQMFENEKKPNSLDRGRDLCAAIGVLDGQFDPVLCRYREITCIFIVKTVTIILPPLFQV